MSKNIPTTNGKDQSPTSFDEARALDIARQIATKECGSPMARRALNSQEREIIKAASGICGEVAEWLLGEEPYNTATLANELLKTERQLRQLLGGAGS